LATDIDEEFYFGERSFDITHFQDDGKIEKFSDLKSDDPEGQGCIFFQIFELFSTRTFLTMNILQQFF
jgi:hypothetical protein